MTLRRITSGVLLLAALASAGVGMWGIDNHAVAPVPFAQLGLVPDHAQQAAPIAAQMPRFFVTGAETQDNRKANVRLWEYAKQINGGQHLPSYPQETGDCVSHGAKNAGEYFLCTAIAKGLLPDAEFHPLFPPYIYGTSRVQVGKKKLGKSPGSVGAWAAQAVAEYGVLRADNPDTPEYSGKLADKWGWEGPPKEFIEASKMFTFDTVAQVHSADEVRDAICNGYPVTIASDFGTKKIVVKDNRRVAIRNSRWFHQMAILGYDGSTDEGPWYFVKNSWFDTSHPAPMQGEPPCGFWISESDVEYIVRQGDSFAYSGFNGFPANDLKPDFTIPVSDAGPRAPDMNIAAMETVPMFPLDPDWAGLVWSAAGVFALLAVLVWFVKGNRSGRATLVVVALALISSAATMPATAQDWGQISEVATSPTPTSVTLSAGSELPDADVSAAFAQIVTVALSPQETATTAAIQSPDFGGIVREAFAITPEEKPEPAGVQKLLDATESQADAAPTPISEVVRVLALLPEPQVGFVDFGCGADARWCVAAAERWRCPVIGVEIDPKRAALAAQRIATLGLGERISIINADATQVDVNADVGVAYLYSDVLESLKPRIEKLRAFASYLHQPPGLQVVKNGDSWIYVRQQPAAQAVWGGHSYSHPVCNNPNCAMCASIRGQLASAAQPKPQPKGATANAPQAAVSADVPKGRYEWRDVPVCEYGLFGKKKNCRIERRQVWVAE